jgi:CRP-like cAMP-binding protein
MAADAPESKVRWRLTAKERAILAQGRRPRTYPVGDALFLERDLSYFAILILEGRVRVTSEATASLGAEKVLDYRGPHDVVGELSAIDRQPRSATVRAVSKVKAVVVGAEDLNKFLNANPKAMRRLLVALVGCLRDADARVESRAYEVPCRIARGLLELARRHGEPSSQDVIELPMSQRELAGWVEVSLRATVDVLEQLDKAGAIERGQYRRIVVRDLGALRRFKARACPQE